MGLSPNNHLGEIALPPEIAPGECFVATDASASDNPHVSSVLAIVRGVVLWAKTHG
jgi:hypothetical protein